MNEQIVKRLNQREERTQAHMGTIEQEIDDLLADGQEALSQDQRNLIKDEVMGYARGILDALSYEELSNLGCLEAFILNLRAHVRMSLHGR
jgi:hypothetical protein